MKVILVRKLRLAPNQALVTLTLGLLHWRWLQCMIMLIEIAHNNYSADIIECQVMVGPTTVPLSQEATVPNRHTTEWSTINEELASMLSPIHAELANDVSSPCEAADEFTTLIIAHLRYYSVIQIGQKHKPPQPTAQHR